MIAISGSPTKLRRYPTRSCAPLGTSSSWKPVEPKPAVDDLPPSEIVETSVRAVPAMLPLMVLPVAGGQKTSVPTVNSACVMYCTVIDEASPAPSTTRSEEHTSELQSRLHLVCRLLPEKKNHTH